MNQTYVHNHYKCIKCGQRFFNKNKALKHSSKTQHMVQIDRAATEAHRKYKARTSNSSYLERLLIRDHLLDQGHEW